MSDSIDLALDNPRKPEAAALPPLPRLSGYDLIREKGRGPRAVVFKARRMFENDTVAVKLFHPGACTKDLQARLEAGIERTAKLDVPGLIRALGFGTDKGRAFLVMEYASGEALSNFLFRRQQFPVLKTIAVILHCARALKSAAASGFYHGRLHPGAIVLSRNNVRIIGVGMGARPEHAAWPAGQDQAPHVFEPLIYAAPEAMPSKPVPANQSAADIYSLGAILFHMLACAPPYKSSDEVSIAAERAELKPRHPVVWPVEVFSKLSPEIIALVEALLAPDPPARPDYDTLLLRAGAIQQILQQSSAPAPSGATLPQPAASEQTVVGAPTVLKKLDATVEISKEKTASRSGLHDMRKEAGASAKAHLASASGVTEKAHASSPAHSARKARAYAPRSAVDVIFSTLLFGMTVLVVLCVVYVTLQPQLPEKYQLLKGLIAADHSRAGNNSSARSAPDAAAGSNSAISPDGASADHSPRQVVANASPEEQALARRQLDKIQEMLKSAEIQPSEGLARVLRGIAEKTGVVSATGIRASIMAGDMESRSASGKQSDNLTPELAKALTSAAEAMKTAAQNNTPPTPAQPAPAVPAKVEKPPAPEKAAPAVSPLAGPLVQARAQMKNFGYVKAKETVAQFAAKGDTEQKRLAADFQLAMSYEEGLFERCRAKLVDQIKKNPRHESPLQVFPRKDDPIGDDIVNFDEKGLHILVRSGPNQGEKVTPWEKAPAAQVMNLLAALTTKSNLEDQLGLAAFAFDRGLNLESEEAIGRAQALPNGKEKATSLAEVFTRLGHALQAP